MQYVGRVNMLKIFCIEYKKILFSLRFLLCLIILGVIYVTQCLPEKWLYYLEPMDEVHFFYNCLKEDKERGSTETVKGYAYDYVVGATKRVTVYNKHYFNEQEIKFIDETVEEIDKNVMDNINPAKVKLKIDYSEMQNYLDRINVMLGGDSYYSEDGRAILYETYLHNILGEIPIGNVEDLSDEMYNYLQNSIKQNCYLSYYLDVFQSEKHYNEEEAKKIKEINDRVNAIYTDNLSDKLKYDNIVLCYNEIDEILGGNTVFGEKYRNTYFKKTYSLEEAKKQYSSIINIEKLTNTYARYYGDYMTVFAGILPAVLGAFSLWYDYRHKTCEIIGSKKISSFKYLFLKFLSLVSAFFTAFMIFAIISTALFLIFAHKYTIVIDYLAFFKYTIFWTMPTVCCTTATAMFIYILFQNPIPSLAIETLVFFFSMKDLYGYYYIWKPIIRYNIIGRYDFYLENYYAIIRNRVVIFVLSIVIVLLCSFIFELRRRGMQWNSKLHMKYNDEK